MLRLALFAALALACSRPAAPTPASAAPPPEAAPPSEAAVQPLDLSRPGSFTSGRWEYRFLITAEGSKSEGERGELLYDGKPVPPAITGDYYATPWGNIGWVGDPETPWGSHGWFLRESDSTWGRLLPPPE